jgi:hypothetical protein
MYEDGTKIDDSCSTIAVCRSMEGTFALEGTQQTENPEGRCVYGILHRQKDKNVR